MGGCRCGRTSIGSPLGKLGSAIRHRARAKERFEPPEHGEKRTGDRLHPPVLASPCFPMNSTSFLHSPLRGRAIPRHIRGQKLLVWVRWEVSLWSAKSPSSSTSSRTTASGGRTPRPGMENCLSASRFLRARRLVSSPSRQQKLIDTWSNNSCETVADRKASWPPPRHAMFASPPCEVFSVT